MKKLFITLLVIVGVFNCQCFGFSFTKISPNAEQAEVDQTTQQAKVLYAQNEIDEALKLLKDKTEESRTEEDWLMMGNILQDKEKIDEAAYMFKKSIEVNPKFYKAYYNLGCIYLAQDKPNMALAEFKKAVKYKPDFSYGYYNIGCAYLKLKQYGSAKYNFFKSLDLRANEPNVYYNIAYTYKMLNKEKQAQTYLDLYNKMTEDHDF